MHGNQPIMPDRYAGAIGMVVGAAVGVLAGWDVFLVFFSAVAGVAVVDNAGDVWRWARRRRECRQIGLLAPHGRAPAWVRAQAQRAGVGQWRSGGRRTLLTEPVLVSWRSGQLSFRNEIYDQEGNLIASGSRLKVPEQSRLRRWLSSDEIEFCDPNGNALNRVTSDGRNPRFLGVTDNDGRELGTVSLRRKDRGSIRAAGELVGWVRRSGRLQQRLGFGRRFDIYDADDAVVGHVTRTEGSQRSTCNVLDFDERVASRLRTCVLAIDAAVCYWLRPTS
jgi:hypothetical protein